MRGVRSPGSLVRPLVYNNLATRKRNGGDWRKWEIKVFFWGGGVSGGAVWKEKRGLFGFSYLESFELMGDLYQAVD